MEPKGLAVGLAVGDGVGRGVLGVGRGVLGVGAGVRTPPQSNFDVIMMLSNPELSSVALVAVTRVWKVSVIWPSVLKNSEGTVAVM